MNQDLKRKKNMTKNTDHFICKYLLICMKFLQLTKSNSYSSLSVIEFMIPTPHLLGEVYASKHALCAASILKN